MQTRMKYDKKRIIIKCDSNSLQAYTTIIELMKDRIRDHLFELDAEKMPKPIQNFIDIIDDSLLRVEEAMDSIDEAFMEDEDEEPFDQVEKFFTEDHE
jgi:hypothetical protein